MFTVHDLDREGNPHKELLRSEYIDIIEHAVFGLVRHRYPESSSSVQQMIDVGTRIYVICEDGKPYRYIQLQSEQCGRWRLEYPNFGEGE